MVILRVQAHTLTVEENVVVFCIIAGDMKHARRASKLQYLGHATPF